MNTMYGTPAGGYRQPSGRSFLYPVPQEETVPLGRWSPWPACSQAAGSPWRWCPGAALRRPARRPSAAGARAAELNTALSAAASSSSTPPARVRWALGRLRRLGGVDGTVTFHNKTGFHTVSFERGTVQSVSGSDVVIKAADGTTWTWQIVSDTVVRKNGAKTTTSALSAGETVFAGGPVVNGARDARLIVIRVAGSSGPTGSQSAQTSLS